MKPHKERKGIFLKRKMTTINKPRDVEEQETPEIALPDVY